MFFSEIIYYFIYFLFPLIIIKKYTVFHNLIILIFDNNITFDFHGDEIWKLILNIAFIFIVLFLLLVFNEIIEINCCGLQINTKNNIIKRAIIDSYVEREIENSSSDSNSSIDYEGYTMEMDD